MFRQAHDFNQDISGWNTENVTNMYRTFYISKSFNQNLSMWCVSNFNKKPNEFDGYANSWNLPRPIWSTCP
jgi:surface protein